MKTRHFITGAGKAWIYLRIIAHIPLYYALRPGFFRSPMAYIRFLRRALQLLLIFRHNKVVRVFNGYKLHLYLPAYPSRAFFHAIESKLLHRPPGATTIVFSMTKACSYHCRHCYQQNDSGADLDEALMIRTAQAARDAGAALFDIEGGEPFLRYPRLLNLVRSLDDRCEIWINSTGAHIQPGMLEELRQAGLFGMMVSIHSPDRDRHDAFTGVPGSFDTAVGLLRRCRDLNLVAAFNSVLSEEEIREKGLDRLMDLARELDVDYVQLIHPKPAGSWLGRKDGMQMDPALLHSVRQAHRLYNSRAQQDYPSLAAQVFEESTEVLGCTAGAVDRYYIGAGGDVQPCEFLNLSFGNVRDESFAEIFSRMRAHFPIPCCEWLCCQMAGDIQRSIARHRLTQTPLPWALTRTLVEGWTRGRPTPIYQRLGIYR